MKTIMTINRRKFVKTGLTVVAGMTLAVNSYDRVKSQTVPSELTRKAVKPVNSSNPPVPYGSRIQRTMHLLATSTPERKNKVRVLIYGQSITQGPWVDVVKAKLETDFPNADMEFVKRPLGGFGADLIIDCMEADLYPFYPDLVIFHVYGGTKGYGAAGEMCTLEKLYRNLRRRTTSEMLTLTHHIVGKDDAGMEQYIKGHDSDSEVIRQLADKYGYEVADIRPDWKKQVEANGGNQMLFLSDGTHPNAKGNALMASLVIPHLKFNPKQKSYWHEMVKVYTADGERWRSDEDDLPSKGALLSKPLKLHFDGNRVDLIAMPIQDGKPGTARILVDGKVPSTIPGVYATTRTTRAAPGSGWPALRRVDIGREAAPVAEDWTLTFTMVNDNTHFEYALKGSVTGADGKGNGEGIFTSNSGRIIIDPQWFTFGSKPLPLPLAGDMVKWSVVKKCADTWMPNLNADPTKEDRTTLSQGLTNSSHTLEIIPNGDGPLNLRAIVVYQPPEKE